MVLSEDEAIELLAFLVTAARTQSEEPTDYGPLRLLTAAERLTRFISERASPDTRSFLASSLELYPRQLREADPEFFDTTLDSLCRAVAQHLVERSGLDRG